MLETYKNISKNYVMYKLVSSGIHSTTAILEYIPIGLNILVEFNWNHGMI